MSQSVLLLALVIGLGLAGTALSLFVLLHTRALIGGIERRARVGREECQAALVTLRDSLDGLAAQIHDLQQQPPLTVVSAPPRPGLNLSKRSQALRMQRRGDSPEQIAAALEIPLQEVDLLLKVHRIVLSTI